MNRILTPARVLALAGLLTAAPLTNANGIASRSQSKSDLIKRCMVKSMSARHDLQYNDAAKECATQVELQSNTATPTPVPAKS